MEHVDMEGRKVMKRERGGLTVYLLEPTEKQVHERMPVVGKVMRWDLSLLREGFVRPS